MARSFFLVLFAVATLLHGSAAQTRHVVGDSIGWTIPSGGAATYTAWASGKTFVVGDTLGTLISRILQLIGLLCMHRCGLQLRIFHIDELCSV